MDVILYWNDVALEANRVSHTTGQDSSNNGPTRSSRALAIVHLAMYDAYARAKGNPATLPVYNPAVPTAPTGTNSQVAAAGAAHRALSVLYPSQSVFFDAKLSTSPMGIHPASLAYGVQVADVTLSDRSSDPSASTGSYVFSTVRGSHRQDPDNPSPSVHGPTYGQLSKGFSISQRHALDSPPALTDQAYKNALKQVTQKGIAPELEGTLPPNVSKRSAEETIIGIFWGYDGAYGIGTPPRLYNQIIRKLADIKGNMEDENARLFALVNVAMADAGILAWEQKYRYNLMRPVVGIREGDKSLGADAVGGSSIAPTADPLWLPLGAPKSNVIGKNFTPPFPAYPSGHATFGAAALHIARLFYNVTAYQPDNLFGNETIVSDELNGMTTDNKGAIRPKHTRKFPGGLWQMIEENGFSRVYLGVHWSFDAFALDANGKPDVLQNIGGVPLGLKIAEDIFNGHRNNGLRKSTVGPVV